MKQKTNSRKTFLSYSVRERIIAAATLLFVCFAFASPVFPVFGDDDSKLIDEYVKATAGDIISFDAANIKQFWVDNSVFSQNDKINIVMGNASKDKTFESVPLKLQLANVKYIQRCKIDVITEESDVSFQVKNAKNVILAESILEKDFIQNHIYSASFLLKDTFSDYSFSLVFSSKKNDLISIRKIILSFETAQELLLIEKPEVIIVPPDPDQAANEAREKHIESEKARIEAIAASMESQKDIYPKLKAEKAQKEFNKVLFSTDPNSGNRFAAHLSKTNSIEGLTALNRFLLKNGIHLIVVVWPLPDEVSADLFFPELVKEGQYLHIARVELMKELLANGVEVLDLLPALVKKRFEYPPLLFQADRYDSLPAFGAARIAGEEIANLLKRYDLPANDADTWSLDEIPMRKGREYGDNKDIGVFINEKRIEFDNHSSVMFIGDQFVSYPQRYSAIAAYCSYYLQQKVGSSSFNAGVPGLFKSTIQEHQTDSFLNKKKVIVISANPLHLIQINCQMPNGYPDFPAEAYKIQKSYSIYMGYDGVRAEWDVSGDEIEFSDGKIPREDKEHAKEKVKIMLPDFENTSTPRFLRVISQSSGRFSLAFNEADSQEVNVEGTSGSDELLIPVKTGKDMSITIPRSVSSIQDISFVTKEK